MSTRAASHPQPASGAPDCRARPLGRWISALCILGLSQAFAASSSPSYTVRPDSLDAGGGKAQSAIYLLESSFASFGGVAAASSPSTAARIGFAAQLNDPPAAAPESYSSSRDTLLAVSAPGVLANDLDYDRDPLSAVIATAPANGALTLNPNGSFTYTPAAGFVGSDSFTYHASDGINLSAAIAVTIRVDLVNQPPLAAADSFSTPEDISLLVPAPGVLANDVDPAGDTLTAVLIAPPAHGSLTLNPDGSFLYAPNPDYHGADSFTYAASDGQVASAPATVSIQVTPINDPPVATPLSLSTAEDTPVAVLLSGIDAEASPLTFSILTQPAQGVLSGLPPNLTYTPNPDFHGTDGFTYVANDGASDSFPATVSVTITPVNDTPVAANDSYSTASNTPLVIAAPGVLANDSDADGDPLAAVLDSPPASGSLTLQSTGAFVFTPAAGFSGQISFTYRASDSFDQSLIATVTIRVGAANQAPVAVNDGFTTAEDTPLAIPGPGVLANDSDADGDNLTAALVVGTSRGSLTLSPSGGFLYTPAPNFHGSDSFTYRASDGQALSAITVASILVTPVNDPPVAHPQAVDLPEDSARDIILTGTDLDGDTLTFVLLSNPARGALSGTPPNLRYTPEPNFHGVDSFTFKVNDGLADSAAATVAITLTPVNDPPLAIAQNLTLLQDQFIRFTLSGFDLDGDPLAYFITAPVIQGSIAGVPPELVYTPRRGFFGADSLEFKVSDGAADSAAVRIHLNILQVNAAPALTIERHWTSNEDETLAIPFQISDPESGPERLSIAAESLSPDLLPQSGITLEGAGSARTLRLHPAVDQTGTGKIRLTLTDPEGASATQEITLEIRPINDPPIPLTSPVTLLEDSVATITLQARDPDGPSLSFRIVEYVAHGSLSGEPPNLVYRPAANFHGTDRLVFEASDGLASSTPAALELIVLPVQDPPEIDFIPDQITDEDIALHVAFVLRDPDGLAGIRIETETDDPWLFPASNRILQGVESARTLLLAPVPEQFGSTRIRLRAVDPDGLTASREFQVTVREVKDPPFISAIADLAVLEDSVGTVADILVFDPDSSPPRLSFALSSSNPSLIDAAGLRFEGEGILYTLRLTPKPDQNGSAVITLRVQDAEGGLGTRSFTLRVLPVNDPPRSISRKLTTMTGVSIAFALTGLDPDLDPLQFELAGFPLHGQLSGPLPNLIYTPNTGFQGEDAFPFLATDGTLLSDSGTITIQVLPAGQGRRFISISRGPHGTDAARLTFLGIAGKTYHLEHTDDITRNIWSTLQSIASADGGELTFVDSSSPLPSVRFYRIREE